MHLGRVWLICEHINAIKIDIIKFKRLNVNYISSNHFYIVFEVLGLEGLRSLGVQCVFNVASSCNPSFLSMDVQKLIVECSSAVRGIKINPARL